MKLLFTLLLALAGLAQTSLFGASVIIPVSPDSLEQSNFTFQFNIKPNSEGIDVDFKATLKGDTPSTFTGSLGLVKITQTTSEIKGMRVIPIHNRGKVYTANFRVESDLLDTKHLCFIFKENVQVMMNGKVTPMPSATSYTFPLKDFHSKKATATDSTVIHYSPDKHYYIGWFDYDAGPPFGLIRLIMLRSSSDSYDIFSKISVPRYTKAAWNPSSTKCFVADAPDNGGPVSWLVYKTSPLDAEQWKTAVLDPFGQIYEEFRKSDPEVHYLFRPSILKISWLSDSTLQLRGYCNSGTYLITIDTIELSSKPKVEKLSDQLLDE
jgi:hypothetical protein